ncbi:hypothetical protein JCM18899A_13840 [Nocardioides sp. AN3]
MPVNPLNPRQQFLPTDCIRLEVETTPTTSGGLSNLCLNPSGDLGAWGWTAANAFGQVDVGGTGGSSGSLGLRYVQTSVSGAGGLLSYFMPVDAGEWVSARYDLLGVSTSRNTKARFQWYDSTRTLLSSTTDSGTGTAAGTFYATSAQAPATTKYVRLMVWLYNGTSGAASINDQFVVRNVMVTRNSANTFSTVRTNLVTNPSFETNTTGWSGLNATLARTTTVAYVGSASMSITATATSNVWAQTAGTFPVTPGVDYGAAFYARAATTPRLIFCNLLWTDAGGSPVGFSITGSATDSTSAWTRVSSWGTAPPGAAFATIYANPIDGVAVGEVHYIDAVIFEATSLSTFATSTYFDGATTNTTGVTHAWTGTANLSTSTETITSYLFVEPRAYQNILSGSHEINISRAPLDASTMTAVVVDPTLDPADTDEDVLAVGRVVRVMALVGSVWEPIYTGSIDNVVTTYVPNKNTGEVKRRIEVHAIDAAQTLANFKSADGYDYLLGHTKNALPATNVPYLVNGVAWPYAAGAAACAKNADASVLDQLAISRDTVLGALAWVDRRGRLQAWDLTKSPLSADESTFSPTITNGTYTGNGENGTITTTAAGNVVLTRLCPVEMGQPYIFNVGLTTTGTNRAYTVTIGWLSIDGITLATTSTLASPSTNEPNGVTLAGYAPQGAYFAQYSLVITGSAATQTHAYTIDTTFDRTRYSSVPADAAADHGDSYSNIDASFSTSSCINVVNVNWNRYDAATGETTQVPYGPYVDQNSVDKNGPYSATFTLQGATESAAAIQAYAQAVLAANATPVRQANSITVAVLDDKGIRHAALNDLCTPASVFYYDVAAGGYLVASIVRIETIQHTITPEGWLVDYTFSPTSSVAAPQVTPVPTNAPVGRPWDTLTHQANNTLTSGAWTRLSGMGVFGNGGNINANSASILIAEPGWYLVSGAVNHAWGATANRCGALIDVATNVGDSVVGAPAADGSGGLQQLVPRSSTAALVVSVSGTLYCSAGQYLRLWAYQDNGANQTLVASGSTYIKAVKIGAA